MDSIRIALILTATVTPCQWIPRSDVWNVIDTLSQVNATALERRRPAGVFSRALAPPPNLPLSVDAPNSPDFRTGIRTTHMSNVALITRDKFRHPWNTRDAVQGGVDALPENRAACLFRRLARSLPSSRPATRTPNHGLAARRSPPDARCHFRRHQESLLRSQTPWSRLGRQRQNLSPENRHRSHSQLRALRSGCRYGPASRFAHLLLSRRRGPTFTASAGKSEWSATTA